MLYETIVCATDGFAHSDDALRHAARLAAETSAELHVVQVSEPPLTARFLAGEYIACTPGERRSRTEKLLVQVCRERGVRVTAHYLSSGRGSPATQIAQLAQELEADVIVVGSRGRSPVGGALLGSVSQRLPHLTVRPILVVPDHDERRLRRGGEERQLVGAKTGEATL
jgi:nucleotide-binding universal stress UspA family protein